MALSGRIFVYERDRTQHSAMEYTFLRWRLLKFITTQLLSKDRSMAMATNE